MQVLTVILVSVIEGTVDVSVAPEEFMNKLTSLALLEVCMVTTATITHTYIHT